MPRGGCPWLKNKLNSWQTPSMRPENASRSTFPACRAPLARRSNIYMNSTFSGPQPLPIHCPRLFVPWGRCKGALPQTSADSTFATQNHRFPSKISQNIQIQRLVSVFQWMHPELQQLFRSSRGASGGACRHNCRKHYSSSEPSLRHCGPAKSTGLEAEMDRNESPGAGEAVETRRTAAVPQPGMAQRLVRRQPITRSHLES